LLLDEPTSGLDPKASNEFSDLLKRMSGTGVAVPAASRSSCPAWAAAAVAVAAASPSPVA
ncbi:MAG: hypothetical protein ABMA25_16095, partial [Ilumatobacteraceae bacterium]